MSIQKPPKWKNEILENAGVLVDVKRRPKLVDESSPDPKLDSDIGKLKMQVYWLKKSSGNEPCRSVATNTT